jgi:hypothetical protein
MGIGRVSMVSEEAVGRTIEEEGEEGEGMEEEEIGIHRAREVLRAQEEIRIGLEVATHIEA